MARPVRTSSRGLANLYARIPIPYYDKLVVIKNITREYGLVEAPLHKQESMRETIMFMIDVILPILKNRVEKELEEASKAAEKAAAVETTVETLVEQTKKA